MWRCRDSGVCQESYIPYSDGIAQRQGGVVQCSTLLRKAIVAYVCSDKFPNIFFNPTIKPYVLHKHHVGVLVSFCNLKKAMSLFNYLHDISTTSCYQMQHSCVYP